MRKVIPMLLAVPLLLGFVLAPQAEAANYMVVGMDRWGQFEVMRNVYAQTLGDSKVVRAKRLDMIAVNSGAAECKEYGTTSLSPAVTLEEHGEARMLLLKDTFNNNVVISTTTTIYIDEGSAQITDKRIWSASDDQGKDHLNKECYASSGDLAYWDFKVSHFENGFDLW